MDGSACPAVALAELQLHGTVDKRSRLTKQGCLPVWLAACSCRLPLGPVDLLPTICLPRPHHCRAFFFCCCSRSESFSHEASPMKPVFPVRNPSP